MRVDPELIPRERVQRAAQTLDRRGVTAEPFAEGAEHGANPWRPDPCGDREGFESLRISATPGDLLPQGEWGEAAHRASLFTSITFLHVHRYSDPGQVHSASAPWTVTR